CHGDLPAHGGGADALAYADEIHRFQRDHPQFRITDHAAQSRLTLDKATDPSRLKFNHRLHLKEGMTLDDGGKPFRYKDMNDPSDGEQYARQAGRTLDDTVKLVCASCHQLDSEQSGIHPDPVANLPAAAVSPPRAAGATMLPIVYEKHCKACHPLTFEGGQASVPHRLQPDALREFLERHYAGQLLKGNPSVFDKKIPARLVPGKSSDPSMEQAKQRIQDQVRAAEKLLHEGKKTCRQCHHYDAQRRIVPPDVPTVWLPHARFSHSAHRAVDCTSCHPRAYDSIEAKDILLPGIEVCVQCHAPAGKNSGAARANCTE